MAWLPITYREFYDVPRMFVVERDGALYLFDSAFDEMLDDYSPHYLVYGLPEDAREAVQADSWAELSKCGTMVGQVAVDDVAFDESRRAAVNDAVFRLLPR